MSSTDPTPPVEAAASELPPRKRQRALDTIDQLNEDLALDALDYGKWLELLGLVEKKDKPDQVKETYEKFLEKFPSASPQWIAYIENCLGHSDNAHAESLFGRCLTTCRSVPLWLTYITYIRRTHDVVSGGEQNRQVVFLAFEVACDNVGIDVDSGALWEQYVEFIDNWKPTTQWEQQQKTDLKRKVYNRCVVLPLRNVEKLWADYTAFENQIDAANARRLVAERLAAYMAARLWVKEFSNLTAGLKRDAVPARGTYLAPRRTSQAKLWRRWIAWERANRLALAPDALAVRIEHVYAQATEAMRFQSQFWYESAQYWLGRDCPDRFVEITTQGLACNPTSHLLAYLLAEWYEQEAQREAMDAVYTGLIASLARTYPALPELQKPLVERAVSAVFATQMHATKRAANVQAARGVFKAARQHTAVPLTHHLFVEYAEMEMCTASDGASAAERAKVVERAGKVYAIAVKRFAHDAVFWLKYLRWWLARDNTAEARVMVKQALESLKTEVLTDAANLEGADPAAALSPLYPEAAVPVLMRMFVEFIAYEAKHGDIAAMRNLEAQYLAVFPGATRLALRSQVCQEAVAADFDAFDPIGLFDVDPKSRDKKDEEPKRKRAKTADDEALDAFDAFQTAAAEPEFPDLVITDEVYNLLRVLPKNTYYDGSGMFDSVKLTCLLGDLKQ